MLLTIFAFGQVSAAAASTSALASSVGAVPVSVIVSPTRFRLKSGMLTEAPNSPPNFAKSGGLTPGVTVRLSITLAPGNACVTDSISDFFTSSSGSSPARVKPLPLRRIENGAKLAPGALASGPVIAGPVIAGPFIAGPDGTVRVADAGTLGTARSMSF